MSESEKEEVPAEFPHVESSPEVTEIRENILRIKDEIGKFIIGQESTIDFLIIAILIKGHVLVEGVPGIAKTYLAKIFANTIKSGFSRIQFTPDLMPSDILGTNIFNLKTSEFSGSPSE